MSRVCCAWCGEDNTKKFVDSPFGNEFICKNKKCKKKSRVACQVVTKKVMQPRKKKRERCKGGRKK